MKHSITKLGLLTLLAILLAIGCSRDNNADYEFDYDTIVTESPVNLEHINSSYDDYNSALPYDYAFGPGIIFSSNRNSAGGHFDLIFRVLIGTYHSRDDVFDFGYTTRNDLTNTYTKLQAIETPFNELGPVTYFGDGYDYWLFADDSLGHYDIRYIATQGNDLTNVNTKYAFETINSEYDDYYPTIAGDEVYFCSNRDGESFNIYDANFSNNLLNPTNTETHQVDINLNTTLSSDGNDKCPHFFQYYGRDAEYDVMLFTSDRAGGFGGYDLYYSIREDGEWSEPINMGETINSEDNEYRPIAISSSGLSWTKPEFVIIFSSDRAGGLGGYDLHAARYQF